MFEETTLEQRLQLIAKRQEEMANELTEFIDIPLLAYARNTLELTSNFLKEVLNHLTNVGISDLACFEDEFYSLAEQQEQLADLIYLAFPSSIHLQVELAITATDLKHIVLTR